MARRFLVIALLVLPHVLWASRYEEPRYTPEGERQKGFIETKVIEQSRTLPSYRDIRDNRKRGRRWTRRQNVSDDGYRMKVKRGKVFDVEKVTDYKVLRDDEVVEIRNPKTGKRVITVMRASALPEEDLNRVDLEYNLMELDRLSIRVEKHDEEARSVRVGWDGKISYPLIGEIDAKGKTLTALEKVIAEKFKEYIHKPVVHVDVSQKSPLARILVVGSGFREFQGHEKVLDILGAGYQQSVENAYDRVCVIRKYPDNSYRCIVIDMEYMFKKFDFSQNIPLKAGDIIQVKKMPPLFGYKFKFWWQQILSWMNEVDEMFSAVKSVHNFELEE